MANIITPMILGLVACGAGFILYSTAQEFTEGYHTRGDVSAAIACYMFCAACFIGGTALLINGLMYLFIIMRSCGVDC